jgi:hypothetical protein
LLTRLADRAESGYAAFRQGERALGDQVPLRMSRLTTRLLEAIDWDSVAEKRKANYAVLGGVLGGGNRFPLQLRAGQVPFCYPFVGADASSRKRLIENTPTSTAHAAAMGPVEIHGRAIGPYGLISPLSELDCYYYAASIWRQDEGAAQSSWERVGEEVLCVPFFIADETGSILIDPRGAELDLPPTFDGEAQPYGSEMARHLISRHHAEGILKLKEVVIQPGDSLYVLARSGTLTCRTQ